MASFNVTDFTGLTETQRPASPALDTGDLRRGYAFGSKRIAKISPEQHPYFHIMAMFKNILPMNLNLNSSKNVPPLIADMFM